MTGHELVASRLRVHMERKRHQRYSYCSTGGPEKVHGCEDEVLELDKDVDREGVI